MEAPWIVNTVDSLQQIKEKRKPNFMKVPYLDLRVVNQGHKKALLKRFERVLDHGRIINGPEVEEFEDAMASRVGVRFALGTSSGSSALFLALQALNIGPGDEVITTAYTWIITVNAIAAVGAKPVFVDVGPDFNIDPDKIERKINSRTKAIMPMHVGGHMCNMIAIEAIARKHGLYVVEDAAQAVCSSLGSRKAGQFSTIAAFSMNPMKVLHGYGESGVLTTNSKTLYNKLVQLRHAGTSRDVAGVHINRCRYVSLNHKIDTIQTSFLLENLKRLDKVWEIRDRFARRYDKRLRGVVGLQRTQDNEVHGRYLYLITCRKRNALRKALEERGIETKVVYSPLACDADVYKKRSQEHLPVSRRLLRESLSIPLHEKMSNRQVDFVSDAIRSVCERRKQSK